MKIKNLWRNNIIRKKYIHSRQFQYLSNGRFGWNGRFIIFLVPGYDRVNGGILSIISLAEETARLKDHHGADVFVCSMPDDPPLSRFTKFRNSTHVVGLDILLACIPDGGQVFIHIPEIFVKRFINHIQTFTNKYPALSWRFNVLLQNIDLIPRKEHVKILQRNGEVTCTTAHKAYSNENTEMLLGCPVYHFSTSGSPEKFDNKKYQDKENIVVVSPDKHPRRKEILDSLKEQMSGFKFKVVKNMTYEQYKNLISRAKYSVTFGEGLDGYFGEMIFSGGIGCTVYNNRFFTADMNSLPFVYRSWDELKSTFPREARETDNAQQYQTRQLIQFKSLASQYSYDKHISYLIKFYESCPFN